MKRGLDLGVFNLLAPDVQNAQETSTSTSPFSRVGFIPGAALMGKV